MIESLKSGRQGLLSQVTRHDVIANNLANAATPGFKREVARQTIESRPGDPTARELIISSLTDHSQGSFQRTGNTLDIAIENDGYFVVERDGESFYTRVGNFRLDETGRIVTDRGDALTGTSGPITIDLEEGTPTVATDGSVKVGLTTQGNIRVVRFEEPMRLERAGGNLFRASDGQSPQDLEQAEIRLLPGFIEGSNVNPVREMVSMITALRAYQTMEKSVQSADEMLDTMINRVGRVNASG